MTKLTVAALIAGFLAGAVQVAYLFHVRPFQADLGIQVGGALLAAWLALSLLAFSNSGLKAKWTLLPLPIAMIGPGMLIALVAACTFGGSCP